MIRTKLEGDQARKGTVLVLFVLLLFSAAAIQPSGASNPATADVIIKAIEQLDLAIEQAVFAHVRFPLEDLKPHAHAVLNVLEGLRGPNYDPSYSDPGDGVGVLNYVQEIRQAPEIRGATEETRVGLENALQNISLYLEQAIAHTLKALDQTQLDAAQWEMRQALAFLSAAKGREKELTAVGGLLALRVRVGEPGGFPPSSEK